MSASIRTLLVMQRFYLQRQNNDDVQKLDFNVKNILKYGQQYPFIFLII